MRQRDKNIRERERRKDTRKIFEKRCGKIQRVE